MNKQVNEQDAKREVELQLPSSTVSSSSSSSSLSSAANSFSLIKLDEISSFGATKQSRLPALIKLTEQTSGTSAPHIKTATEAAIELEIARQLQLQTMSLPPATATQIESQPAKGHHHLGESSHEKQQTSLPADAHISDKENISASEDQRQSNSLTDGFVVLSDQADLTAIGPSLPQPEVQSRPLASIQQQQQPSLVGPQSSIGNTNYLGDSLIDMIINLRSENQNLVRALETNNDYVKERLEEFKRSQEESKKREAQFVKEKSDFEHQIRKLQRQNNVLSDRLKSMEEKLKDMKIEVSESLNANFSSKASSESDVNLYPSLSMSAVGDDSMNQATLQCDAGNSELLNDGDVHESSLTSSSESESSGEHNRVLPQTVNMDTDSLTPGANNIRNGSQQPLSDDPLKLCDRLEQQLNDIGKRDYEICLLQQQLNIYRQDYRLERMANLEAKIQIEKLKQDIERLCFERNQDKQTKPMELGAESTPGYRFDASTVRETLRLSGRETRSVLRAARRAAKKAYRQEKAAAISTAIAAAKAAVNTVASASGVASTSTSNESGSQQPPPEPHHGHHRHRRGHHHHQHPHQPPPPPHAHPHQHHYHPKPPPQAHGSALGGLKAVKDEVVNDLLSTANKAMLTGYKMASTHVNLALDKLSQYEQAQASNLSKSKSTPDAPRPSAPEMPSID